MDYLLELALHPDVLEAIDSALNDEAKLTPEALASLRELKRVSFLATQHPNAWVTEVLHAFYAHADLARLVWVNLRHTDRQRRLVVSRYLSEESAKDGSLGSKIKSSPLWSMTTSMGITKTPKKTERPSESYVEQFKRQPEKAVSNLSKELSTNRDQTEKLCRATEKPPDPPTFLADLMAAEGTPQSNRDKRTQEYLADPDLVRKTARDEQIAIPFSLVQEAELAQVTAVRESVRPPRVPPPDAPPLRRHSTRMALDMNLLGLAFSGGGIRSATFNLGVLQGLSKIGFLKQVDYLSTVSGGGYIGSWLAAWIRRTQDEPGAPPASTAAVMTDIQRRLSPIRSPNPMDERVRPIRYLREYSNYLTPHTGFFSADTWTMIGIYVRNTLLNQVIIAAFFAAALLVPRDWFFVSNLQFPWKREATVGFAALCWLIGVVFLTRNVRLLDPRNGDVIAQHPEQTGAGTPPPEPWWASPIGVHATIVLPWLTATALIARPWAKWAILGAGLFGEAEPAFVPPDGLYVGPACAWVGVIVGFSLLVVLLFGRSYRCWTTSRKEARERRNATLAILLGAMVGGGVAAGLAWAVLKTLRMRTDATPLELSWHITALATPGLVSALSFAIVAMLGMLGQRFPDEHREWWSRLRTVLHIYAVGWLVWMLASLYVPWAAFSMKSVGWKSGLTALGGWIGSTILGVLKGPNAENARKQQAETPAAAPASATIFRYAALVAPYVFVVGLVLAISCTIDILYQYNASTRHQAVLQAESAGAYWAFTRDTAGISLLWTAICAGVGLLFSYRVDINEFSIHHFYKNRLVRCYLGASHTENRKPDMFTGFDADDDLPLARFDHAPPLKNRASDCDSRPVAMPAPYAGPYPIVNCALNLVGGRDLAWQERKATSFIFTPKYCGYDIDRAVLPAPRSEGSEAYVPTTSFYRKNSGPLLGMAMAISGAAANPNMGRASSPALGFLMTVFNVRLGWWIGNPRRRDAAAQAGPPLGLAYTALELFGLTDDERDFVNLSDGGHFDNLGVYELIRRSCRYIIVCDAGQDDRFICEDLGDLVRRCRTDFGVEIDIAVDRIRRRDAAGISQTHCVVGQIHYLNIPRRVHGRLVDENGGPLVPGARPGHEIGYLVYLKPSLTGDEPQDVLEYNRRIPEFPHQTTADQWFDESQFESYRKLGMHVGEQAFARYQSDDTLCVEDMGQLMERLYRYWYPPSVAINERSTDHATEYSRVMDLIRQGPKMEGLDHVMFERLAASTDQLNERDEFYVCNSLVQLIENVYLDIDLERNWDHPHVAGWMGVFRRWVQQPAFRRTWKISESTYADRFRNFYNDRLRGRQLRLPRGFVAYREPTPGSSPQITLVSYDAAIQAGASVIDLQVRQLASGELVVYLGDAIQNISIERWDHAALKGAGVSLLSLEECLRALKGRIRLCVALKTKGIEQAVFDALVHSKWDYDDYALSSTDPVALQNVRRICSEVKLGLHVESRDAFDDAFEKFLEIGADYLTADADILKVEDLSSARDARVMLVPSIMTNPDRLRLFLSHDAVAGIITSDVAQALEIKAELS